MWSPRRLLPNAGPRRYATLEEHAKALGDKPPDTPDERTVLDMEWAELVELKRAAQGDPAYVGVCGAYPENRGKNRYPDVLPNDRTRVKLLSTAPGQTDYINSSFIDGKAFCLPSHNYICAQAPKENTIADFWQMIWENDVSLILMLTNEVERDKVKCAQYWPCAPTPDNKDPVLHAGDFVVRWQFRHGRRMHTAERRGDLLIKRFTCLHHGVRRAVTHIQHTNWPDHGCPEQGSTGLRHLLRISDEYIRCHRESNERRNMDHSCSTADTPDLLTHVLQGFECTDEDARLEAEQSFDAAMQSGTFAEETGCFEPGPNGRTTKNTCGVGAEDLSYYFHCNTGMPPILVHCSAGIGRTGCFITVHILLALFKQSYYHHIDSCQMELARHRERREPSEDAPPFIVPRFDPHSFTFDVFGVIKTLRTQRDGIVQSTDQLRYIYVTLLEEFNVLCKNGFDGSLDHLQYPHLPNNCRLEPPRAQTPLSNSGVGGVGGGGYSRPREPAAPSSPTSVPTPSSARSLRRRTDALSSSVSSTGSRKRMCKSPPFAGALARVGGKSNGSLPSSPYTKQPPAPFAAAPEAVLAHATGVSCVALAAEQPERLLAAAGSCLQLWDVSTPHAKELTRVTAPATLTCAALSPRGDVVVGGVRDDACVHAWTGTGEVLCAARAHAAPLRCLAFSPDGRRLVSCAEDNTLGIWEAAGGGLELLQSRQQGGDDEARSGAVCTVAYSPDGSRIATGGAGGEVRVSDAGTLTGLLDIGQRGHVGGVNAVAFSHDGALLASGGDEGCVLLWDAVSGRQTKELTTGGGAVRSIAMSPNDAHVAAASDDGQVRVWDLRSLTLVQTLDGHKRATCVRFAPLSGRLVSSGAEGSVRVWQGAASAAAAALAASTATWGVQTEEAKIMADHCSSACASPLSATLPLLHEPGPPPHSAGCGGGS
eukprot:Rhum_TRINITY_DN13706_c1_g1::Rhum_TRINITY_DN13706_c1_g1_i1::g.63340::m.63340